MSWVLLIDGYNVLAPVAGPGRTPDANWLQRERMRLVQRLADVLPESVRKKTCVVFDARNPPPNRPDQYTEQGITIRFAIDYPEADDLLEELIRAHHTPKRLMVVSSDHRVQTAASRRGARTSDSEPWLDALVDGKIKLAIKLKPGSGSRNPENPPPTIEGSGAGQGDFKPPVEISPDEVTEWMDEFGFDPPEPR